MGIFEKLGQRPQGQTQPQQGPGQQAQVTPEMMRREIGSISRDPGAYLGQRGFRIPQGMTDAKEITQYLLQTGQVGGGRLGPIIRMLIGGK